MQHGSEELNELPLLFVEAFPHWANLHEKCVVRLGVEGNQPDLSDVVEIVTRFDGRADLIARMQPTHPAGGNHLDEFDRHLWNIITEAVAFAWATESLPAPPAFTDDDGKPDLAAADGTWVEVKSVWESDDERAVTNEMAEAADRGTLLLRVADSFHPASQGFWRKFDEGVEDALAKRSRQGNGELVVFFALTGIDFETNRDDTLKKLSVWASRASSEHGCGIVVSSRGEWREPIVQIGI
jgi:hypothetical protein